MTGKFQAAKAFNPPALALLAAATTAPVTARAAAINTLIRTLVLQGVWGLIDVMYVLAAADSQLAKLNWKNPTGSFNLTAVSSPTFTADRGYTGNGTSSYLSTGYDTSTASIGFSQNSCHLAAYMLTASASGSADVGVVSGTNRTYLRGRNNVQYRVGSASSTNSSSTVTVPALFHVNRPDSANQLLYINGTLDTTGAVASSGVSTGAIALLASPVAPSFSDRQMAAFTAGRAMNAAQAMSLYNALHAYMVTVGASA